MNALLVLQFSCMFLRKFIYLFIYLFILILILFYFYLFIFFNLFIFLLLQSLTFITWTILEGFPPVILYKISTTGLITTWVTYTDNIFTKQPWSCLMKLIMLCTPDWICENQATSFARKITQVSCLFVVRKLCNLPWNMLW